MTKAPILESELYYDERKDIFDEEDRLRYLAENPELTDEQRETVKSQLKMVQKLLGA